MANHHSRVLIKLSGEALGGEQGFGLDIPATSKIIDEILVLRKLGVEIALVIGGGNFFRGAALAEHGFERVTADQIGMLCTVSNGLFLQSLFKERNIPVSLFSTVGMPGVVDCYQRDHALHDLEAGHIVIFTAGIGLPLFSTDSAASLRAIEINADILLKASTVDGVYSADPKKNSKAERYTQLSYAEVIQKQLRVMDLTAICLCQEHNMPIRVFDLKKPSVFKNIISGKSEGTLITG